MMTYPMVDTAVAVMTADATMYQSWLDYTNKTVSFVQPYNDEQRLMCYQSDQLDWFGLYDAPFTTDGVGPCFYYHEERASH